MAVGVQPNSALEDRPSGRPPECAGGTCVAVDVSPQGVAMKPCPTAITLQHCVTGGIQQRNAPHEVAEGTKWKAHHDLPWTKDGVKESGEQHRTQVDGKTDASWMPGQCVQASAHGHKADGQ